MPHRDDFDDDLMDPSSEAYDYKPVTSDEGKGSKAAKMFMAVTVIAGLAGGAWYFVGSGPTSQDNVPVVRAETSLTKEKPSEPGGMDVPNRDKTVYDRVSGENTEPKLERLLPHPEKPMEKPVKGMALPELSETVSKQTGLPAITKDLPPAPTPVEVEKTPELVEVPEGDEVVAETPAMPEIPSEEMAEEITAPPPAPVVDENAPRALVKRADKPSGPTKQDQDDLAATIAEALNEKATKEESVKPVETPKEVVEKVTPPPAPKSIAKPVPQKPDVKTAEKRPPLKAGYLLQLLSSKSESGVKATWEKIKAKNASIVKGLPANVVKADLGEKGIYYRLRLGPVATGDEAKAYCSKLKKNNVGCFIVRVR